jgi:hypothetical protein
MQQMINPIMSALDRLTSFRGEGGQVTYPPQGQPETIQAVAWHPHQQRLAIALSGEKIATYNLATQQWEHASLSQGTVNSRSSSPSSSIFSPSLYKIFSAKCAA